MMNKAEARQVARHLRQNGHGLTAIRQVVPVAKSTLTRWLRDIELTADQQQRILLAISDARSRARQLGAWRNHQNSLARMRGVIADAEAGFHLRMKDPLFVTGVALYWAEGSKTTRHFQFTNSDPSAIRTMIAWLIRSAEITKTRVSARIYDHRADEIEDLIAFWVVATGLPRSQFRRSVIKQSQHSIKKNPTYMGCCRLDVFSSELRWKLRGWQSALLDALGTSVVASVVPDAVATLT
jgi:hypothetical protein